MKKLKLILTTSAIIVAVVAAFALRENSRDCSGIKQYYYDGAHYKPAGQLGTDYLCIASHDTCTWFQDANYYLPCQIGTYKAMPGK
ncbi:DUF6520 family protein [Puia sp.]|uniref:DUF6520 family protein n=1 Tax=Puia sp. TaxID=2045100 RepID=UPI002F416BDA